MADKSVFPEKTWINAPADESGWSRDILHRLSAELSESVSAAFMIAASGKVVFSWGDLASKCSIASVRKSLINALYGLAVQEARISLDATIRDYNIDDNESLSDLEKQATIRDILRARSGIYHPAVYDISWDRPARNAYAPGQHWFYNNWDFNVLGTILERQMGQSVFEAFANRVAMPLGMEDYTVADGRYHHGPESQHPVYKFWMSARDLARFGLLYLSLGGWAGSQLLPERWIQESFDPSSDLGGGRGYGYLWWTAAARATGDKISVDCPIVYASGFGGQYIILLPALQAVVVHLVANVDRGITHEHMGQLLRLAISAAPTAT